MAKVSLHIAQDKDADTLVSRDPLALLIAMVLDQQVPLEKAFRGPFDLAQRLGTDKLEAGALAAMDPDDLVAAFVRPPALHRYPAAMAKRVQDLCEVVTAEYKGKAEQVWKTAESGMELLRRVKALPGFGDQKARIFVALLGKQLGVRPDGWEAAAAPFGEPGIARSVADITGPESLNEVRAWKKQMKAAAKAAAASESETETEVPAR